MTPHDPGSADHRQRPDLAGLPVDPDLPEDEESAPGRLPAYRPATLLAVAAGGALGAPARIEIARLVTSGATAGFPWATFACNVTGSFVLGLVLVLLVERLRPSRFVRPFLAAGFCGAFTTFSAVAVDLDRRLQTGHVGVAVVYAAATLVAGIVAVAAGMGAAMLVPVHPSRLEPDPS